MKPEEKTSFVLQIPHNSHDATKHILQLLINKIHPVVLKICEKINLQSDENEGSKVRDVFNLCCDQIKKCTIALLDVLRLEYKQGIYLMESRQCYLERLEWCINRLFSIEVYLEKNNNLTQSKDDSANDSINFTVMYFVNWIDHTFEVLNKLSDAIYRTDYKDDENVYKLWKSDMVEYISNLHVSVDELLLSAMTLCRYCLPSDQHIVKARCQVVFRETKALLSEVIEGDFSSPVKVTPEILKLPIKPSNVNILIDILRNVLYVLETNTNTALLALLIHCFSNSVLPIDVLKQHFENSNRGSCECIEKCKSDTQGCSFVKEFDLYNERLLQIGSFAVSCSSDQNRTLNLRSGLASLEGLDPHLVPTLMISPHSHHSELLISSWRKEIQDIRDNVFLIVDPAAFADKSKQLLRQKLLEFLKDNVYNDNTVCSVINIGCVVYDFFDVYDQYEPDALTQHEKILPLLADLKKVQKECKIVSNLLSSPGDFLYEVKTPENKKVSLDQLSKRLKLLYTIVTRINIILNPNDNDDQLLAEVCDDEVKSINFTHTVYKNDETYINSPKKINLSRTLFARTMNVGKRTPGKNLPLAKLTKHLKARKCEEISFSVQLDKLFNTEEFNINDMTFVKDPLEKIRETSILYNFTPAKRSSMRQAVLNRHCISGNKLDENRTLEDTDALDTVSFMDDTNLQITDVLNQINDLTCTWTNKTSRRDLTKKLFRNNQSYEINKKDTGIKNVLTLNINSADDKTTIKSKCVWNIPVKSLDESDLGSNTSMPSNVNTIDRINDLDFVESKLSSLKSQLETSF